MWCPERKEKDGGQRGAEVRNGGGERRGKEERGEEMRREDRGGGEKTGGKRKGEEGGEEGRGRAERREKEMRGEQKRAKEGVCTPEVVNQYHCQGFSRSAAAMHLC